MSGYVLIVENDSSWISNLRKLCRDVFQDKRELVEIQTLFTEPDSLSAAQEDQIKNASLALVDLELGPSTSPELGDMDGLDLVLPRLRKEAPWLPVVLMTSYITPSESVLPRLSSSEFDLLIRKEHLRSLNSNGWKEVCDNAAIHRAAALSARSVFDVRVLLGNEVKIDAPRSFEAEFNHMGVDGFENVFRLLDLGAEEIVLEKIVQGFSGLLAIKAHCNGSLGKVCWLLKLGKNLEKLFQESRRHEEMVRDGFARSLSVPLLRSRPVVWNGIGALAYEFEDGCLTALEFAEQRDAKSALEVIAGALELFYDPSNTRTRAMLPSVPLAGVLERSKLDMSSDSLYGWASGLLGEAEAHPLDLVVGRQHGDLHGRNVLVSSGKALLIDFANYIPAQSYGIPLLDTVHLVLDLAIFSDGAYGIEEVLSPEFLMEESILNFLKRCGVLKSETPDTQERRFFLLAAIVLAARYLNYSDVGTEMKGSIKNALSGPPPSE